jgi:hypothetical protein
MDFKGKQKQPLAERHGKTKKFITQSHKAHKGRKELLNLNCKRL